MNNAPRKNLLQHSLPESAESFAVTNPANGKDIYTLPSLGVKETKAAINRAHKAFDSWRIKTAWERGAVMKQWCALILKNKKAIAEIMHLESGKIMAEALAEVDYAASFIEWSAEEAKRAYGEILPMPAGGKRGIVSKHPVGVVAAITPWNFPAAMITRKVGPALAAGCTVVCKPPRETPLTAIAIHNLAKQAGMPSGVFELVVGDSKIIGKELTTNPLVKKLSFTGSTETGKLLMAQCAGTMKKVTMELGGNAPFLVFGDADIDAAVEGALKSRFRHSGQTCICANRFIVEEGIYDLFAKKLASKVKKLEIGPLINSAAIKKVDKLVRNAGGKILTGGKYKGNFYQPTVITNLDRSSPIFDTEIFGPVATLFKFKTMQEAIKLANDTEYGLAAYIYSGDLKKAWQVADEIDYGMIGVNDVVISSAHSPFGGVKESGMGREGSHYGIEEYLEVKYISLNA